MIQQWLKQTDTSWKDTLTEEERHRLTELNDEWDSTSVVRVGAMTIAVLGLLLGVARNKKYLGLAGIAAPYMLPSKAQNSLPAKTLQGLHILRSRKDIEMDKQELHAATAGRNVVNISSNSMDAE